MKVFIIEACIGTALALFVCYALTGWPGVAGGVLGCIVGLGLVAIRRSKSDR